MRFQIIPDDKGGIGECCLIGKLPVLVLMDDQRIYHPFSQVIHGKPGVDFLEDKFFFPCMEFPSFSSISYHWTIVLLNILWKKTDGFRSHIRIIMREKRLLCGNFYEFRKALYNVYSPTVMWFSVSVVVGIEMYDKLVSYQRENMENDILTLKDIKSCRLRVIRTATGMLQSDLVDKAGISIRTLQSYEEAPVRQ